ncbi:lipoyl(octanoyl) transferase LipB [Desulfoluna spongiiphila]|uniref:Octanoyltransferase n=1 Tax=Desulfoluna spongiiphila TaxID=419481 RepID=A0A1G5H4Y4_9BACT|nr:lipoyl(octanoyl) transferase LipB [Desulfoluna spongiiphila]SCY58774.1 lipoyl(octanoyl) transferase [Desulfoluna spongiiphila]
MNKAKIIELPLTAYEEVHDLQKRLVSMRLSGELDGDVVILVEHPPVYTLGKRGGRENIVVSEGFLKEQGISVVQTERGGNITWHGPGQLVAYPIVHLDEARMGVADFVGALEQVMIETLDALGVSARSDAVNRGVWVGDAKIGSVGIRVNHGVSFHGLALNVAPDLTFFSWINPCGLAVSMTTAEQELGRKVSMTAARCEMKRAFGTLFFEGLVETTLNELNGFPSALCGAGT